MQTCRTTRSSASLLLQTLPFDMRLPLSSCALVRLCMRYKYNRYIQPINVTASTYPRLPSHVSNDLLQGCDKILNPHNLICVPVYPVLFVALEWSCQVCWLHIGLYMQGGRHDAGGNDPKSIDNFVHEFHAAQLSLQTGSILWASFLVWHREEDVNEDTTKPMLIPSSVRNDNQ